MIAIVCHTPASQLPANCPRSCCSTRSISVARACHRCHSNCNLLPLLQDMDNIRSIFTTKAWRRGPAGLMRSMFKTKVVTHALVNGRSPSQVRGGGRPTWSQVLGVGVERRGGTLYLVTQTLINVVVSAPKTGFPFF